MPAPDVETLLQIEDALDAAAVAAFVAAGLVAVPQRSNESILAPYLRVQTTLGEVKRTTPFTVNGDYVPEAYAFTLHVGVLTARTRAAEVESASPGSEMSHSLMRATVRTVLINWQTALASLDYHQVALFAPGASSPEIASGDDHDISSLSFTGVVCIRPDAWPAAVL